MSIVAEAVAGICDILGAELDRIMIERAVVRLVFTGIKQDIGVVDACATPLRLFRWQSSDSLAGPLLLWGNCTG
jgi:hypothetical protein